jgi:CheY-like chemotaxis protein/anti-sigma regulatory factor (Ser/Thr protein kinase)
MDPSPNNANIMLVDDEPINLLLLSEILCAQGHLTKELTNGQEALTSAQQDPPDLIVLDIMMPHMDGFELCQRLKSEESTRDIPIVFVTSNTDTCSIQRGLSLGAYYYLTKPIDPVTLRAVVASALNDFFRTKLLRAEVRQVEGCLYLMDEARFRFRTLKEAKELAVFLSSLSAKSSEVVMGLDELMLNAIEHGNLGISYEEKTLLINQGSWLEEITARLEKHENAEKSAFVQVEQAKSEIRFLISDQGGGFDWKKYLQLDPERAFDCHGRGIAIANLLSFDHVEYLGNGNEVLCISRN